MSNLQESPTARPPQRVLLVDDDELELELMADRLRSLGFETHTVSDGDAALQLLQTQSFPVVITDGSFIPGEQTGPSQQITANIEALLRAAEAGARGAALPAISPRRTEAR